MELKTDETKNIAYIKLSDIVSKKDILDAFDMEVSSDKYKKGMEYGLTPMFKTYSNIQAKSQVMIFDTIDKAETWMMEYGVNLKHYRTKSH